ncbi:MAG: hypothetical protein AAF367_12050 [Pseudomonadota bacterium]
MTYDESIYQIEKTGEEFHRFFDHGAEVRQLTRLADEVGILMSVTYFAEAMHGAPLEQLSDCDLREVTDAFLPLIVHLKMGETQAPTLQ